VGTGCKKSEQFCCVARQGRDAVTSFDLGRQWWRYKFSLNAFAFPTILKSVVQRRLFSSDIKRNPEHRFVDARRRRFAIDLTDEANKGRYYAIQSPRQNVRDHRAPWLSDQVSFVPRRLRARLRTNRYWNGFH
jgi:hypothetical protein